MEETKSIAILGNATRMLAEVQTIDDAKQLLDIAASAKLYARKHNLGKEAVNYAHGIETQAEIKLGEILIQMDKNKGAKGIGKSVIHNDDSTIPPTLSELGVSLNLSSESQLLAKLPEDEKIKIIQGTKSKKKAITENKKKREREDESKKAKDIIISDDHADLRLGDFREKLNDIKDNSIDLILTDPPYPGEFLPLYEDLGVFAKRVLKDGGFLVSYAGHIHLPKVMENLGKSLNYYWCCALLHTGHNQLVLPRNIEAGWKPILLYQKGFKKIENKFLDVITGTGREKDYHEWQQAEKELIPFIESLSKVGDTIIDTFGGGGTTAIASYKLKRKIITCEVDEITNNIAKKRFKKECDGK